MESIAEGYSNEIAKWIENNKQEINMIPLLFVAINKYKEHEKIYMNPQKDRFVLHDEWKKAFHSDDEMDERLREVFGGK